MSKTIAKRNFKNVKLAKQHIENNSTRIGNVLYVDQGIRVFSRIIQKPSKKLRELK